MLQKKHQKRDKSRENSCIANAKRNRKGGPNCGCGCSGRQNKAYVAIAKMRFGKSEENRRYT